MKNLTKINLGLNKIEDASLISNLKKLKKLNLFNNNIEDISFLQDNNILIKEINLAKNNIHDILPLLGLQKLEKVNIKDQKKVIVNEDVKNDILLLVELIKKLTISCKENYGETIDNWSY